MRFVELDGFPICVLPEVMEELGLRQGQKIDIEMFHVIVAKQLAAMVVAQAVKKAQEATRS